MSIPMAALPMITTALSAGSAVVGYVGQQQTANAQQSANDAAAESARIQTIQNYDQLTRQGQQERASATQRVQQIDIDAKKAAASVSASAGESGVGGLSVGSLLADIYGQQGRAVDSVAANVENTQVGLQTQRENVQRGYANTLTTMPTVQRPSLIGTGLQVGAGVAGGYRDYMKIKSGGQ